MRRQVKQQGRGRRSGKSGAQGVQIAWLQEIEDMNEEGWAEDRFREELGKSLAVIEDSRLEYNKTLARIDRCLAQRAAS